MLITDAFWNFMTLVEILESEVIEVAAPGPYIRLIRAFKEAGAVGEENAKTLDEIGMNLKTFMRARLFHMPLKMQISQKRIFTHGDKYYLAEKYSKFPIERLVEMLKSDEQN